MHRWTTYTVDLLSICSRSSVTECPVALLFLRLESVKVCGNLVPACSDQPIANRTLARALTLPNLRLTLKSDRIFGQYEHMSRTCIRQSGLGRLERTLCRTAIATKGPGNHNQTFSEKCRQASCSLDDPRSAQSLTVTTFTSFITSNLRLFRLLALLSLPLQPQSLLCSRTRLFYSLLLLGFLLRRSFGYILFANANTADSRTSQSHTPVLEVFSDHG